MQKGMHFILKYFMQIFESYEEFYNSHFVPFSLKLMAAGGKK